MRSGTGSVPIHVLSATGVGGGAACLGFARDWYELVALDVGAAREKTQIGAFRLVFGAPGLCSVSSTLLAARRLSSGFEPRRV